MLTRRRFLGYSATGMVVTATGCRPQVFDSHVNEDWVSSDASPSLAAKAKLVRMKDYLLGYPVNMNTPPEEFFTWRRELNQAGIGIFAYNNVGNPFHESPIAFNTHDFERELILRFGRVYGFSLNDIWGFLSNSGTDSNMHGMYMGRTLLKGRTGLIPKVYFTKEAHYSIQILSDVLGLKRVIVETGPDSGMDADDLVRQLAANRDFPALVVATVGTTFKGAIDRIDLIQKVLENHPSYLHLDAALFGGYLPYTSEAKEVRHCSLDEPAKERYDSIAVSCHKFFGFYSPAGLYITTKSNFSEFNELFSQVHSPEYIGHVPGTITTSRDAMKPAEFLFFSTPLAMDKQAEDARTMLEHTSYLVEQMQTHFPQLLPIRSNEVSNTIYFRKPNDWIVKKYSLATMRLELHKKKQEFAHAMVMPHVNRQVIAEFLTDLEKDSATGT